MDEQLPSNDDKQVRLGIGLSLALFVFGPILIGIIFGPFFSGVPWLSSIVVLLASPWSLVCLTAWMVKRKGRNALAKGLIQGLIIWTSVIGLLMAACFGILFLGSRR